MKIPEGYTIRTASAEMQVERIHHWLSQRSYWAKGIPFETVTTAVKHSFCIGTFHHDIQNGFARFITDYAVFAYLADVYVEEAHRGLGLSKAMMEVLMQEPWVKKLRRLLLATKDAHGLYAQFGFGPLEHPERMMGILQANPYP
jgi:GNAT superfamily N-acetyltransferase